MIVVLLVRNQASTCSPYATDHTKRQHGNTPPVHESPVFILVFLFVFFTSSYVCTSPKNGWGKIDSDMMLLKIIDAQ